MSTLSIPGILHSSWIAAVALLATQLGCAGYDGAAGGPGVTPGGNQDMEYARTIIEEGGIPASEHFTAEGLFSEHDLPLGGEECGELLCPRAAASWVDLVGPTAPQMLVQLGFGTNIGEDFERRPLRVSVAVDISGSMSDGKLAAVRDALTVMVDQLDWQDSMALVTFDDQAQTVLGMMVMDSPGRETMLGAIDRLATAGSTDIEAGLSLAYSHVEPLGDQPGIEERVFLFTDAQPNTGSTGVGTFMGLAQSHAEDGIGLTVFGLGLDLGSELAERVSSVRGGNCFFLSDDESIRKVFDTEFDYMVTPVAYDLQVEVDAADGFVFTEAYGAPSAHTGPGIEFGASTLFLSSRNGGIGLLLAPEGGLPMEEDGPTDLASFRLAYEPVDAHETVHSELDIAFNGGAVILEQPTQADDLGVYKMSVLLDEFMALEAGSDFCEGTLDLAEAGARIAEARDRLGSVALHLADDPIHAEADLMAKLLDNVAAGAVHCAPADVYEY